MMLTFCLAAIYTAGLISLLLGMNMKTGLRQDEKSLSGNDIIGIILPKKGKRLARKLKILEKSETDVTLDRLYAYKIVSLIAVVLIYLSVSATNINGLIDAELAKKSPFMTFDETQERISRNCTVYKNVVKELGNDAMSEIARNRNAEALKKALERMNITGENAEQSAAYIMDAYDRVSKIRLVDYKILLVALLSFFIPEIILTINGLMKRSKNNRELIKAQGIFEMLARMNVKTHEIIREIAESMDFYKKNLDEFLERYQADRQKAITVLKNQVNSKRFKKFVDIIQVYSMYDRNIAIEMLEREKAEREQELMLVSMEDVDFIEIIAILAIMPLLWELFNLMLKPVMTVVMDTFSHF